MADLNYFIPGKLYKSLQQLGFGTMSDGKREIMHNHWYSIPTGSIIMFLGYCFYEYYGTKEKWMMVLHKNKVCYHYIANHKLNGKKMKSITTEWYKSVEEE